MLGITRKIRISKETISPRGHESNMKKTSITRFFVFSSILASLPSCTESKKSVTQEGSSVKNSSTKSVKHDPIECLVQLELEAKIIWQEKRESILNGDKSIEVTTQSGKSLLSTQELIDSESGLVVYSSEGAIPGIFTITHEGKAVKSVIFRPGRFGLAPVDVKFVLVGEE